MGLVSKHRDSPLSCWPITRLGKGVRIGLEFDLGKGRSAMINPDATEYEFRYRHLIFSMNI